MTDWPLLPILFAGLVFPLSVIHDGYRVKRAEKRNELCALKRIHERKQ